MSLAKTTFVMKMSETLSFFGPLVENHCNAALKEIGILTLR